MPRHLVKGQALGLISSPRDDRDGWGRGSSAKFAQMISAHRRPRASLVTLVRASRPASTDQQQSLCSSFGRSGDPKDARSSPNRHACRGYDILTDRGRIGRQFGSTESLADPISDHARISNLSVHRSGAGRDACWGRCLLEAFRMSRLAVQQRTSFVAQGRGDAVGSCPHTYSLPSRSFLATS